MRAWLICLAWGSATLATGVASAQELSLETVVKIALSRNERAEIADQNVVSAEAAITKARAAFLPTISANASETARKT